jgi:uncharacterized protein YxjI
MNAAFSFTNYVIKKKHLAFGDKYFVYDPRKQPVLYAEHKTRWKGLQTTYSVYTDAGKMQPVLTIQDAKHDDYPNYFEVVETATGEKIGGIGGDWSNWFEDSWAVTDARGATVATVRETSTKRAILHELTDGLVAQVIEILVGDRPVASLRQKKAFIGHRLLVDFSMDTAGAFDRRLGMAIAIVVACHQSQTDSI